MEDWHHWYHGDYGLHNDRRRRRWWWYEYHGCSNRSDDGGRDDGDDPTHVGDRMVLLLPLLI